MNESLLDEIQPAWHFRSSHSRVVDAHVDRVAEAADSFRLDRDASWLVRFFVRARGLSLPGGESPRDVLAKVGFSVLGERPGREIVFGVAGKFWAPREMAHLVRVSDAEEYKAFDVPGEAKGAMSIAFEPVSERRTLLLTETRVTCFDQRAKRLFGAYWTLIRIPSGMIRRDMLRAIARRAERSELTGETRAAR